MRIYSLLIIVLAFATASCEKVIDVDLAEADNRIVINADLNANTGSLDINISRTQSYFESSDLVLVENAAVTLTDLTSGTSYAVPHVSNGDYQLAITPTAGSNYRLSVVAEGAEYIAESTLFSATQITGLSASTEDEGYELKLSLIDAAGADNFYRIKYFVNGKFQNKSSDLLVFTDNLDDGEPIDRYFDNNKLVIGDTVNVELITFDKAAYDYFDSLKDILGGFTGGPSAPGNPTSNWNNGALGHFTAASSHSQQIIL